MQSVLRLSCVVLAAAFALYSPDAAADMLPPGAKGVKTAIQVDAELPEGKAIVLGGTFKGGMVLTPGEVAAVAWHPMGGDMQLHLVDSAIAEKITPLQEAMDRDAIKGLLASTPKCGASFPGVRTIPESEPTAVIRWVYKLGATADGCEASLEKTIFLDESGASVAGPGGEPAVELGAPPGAPASGGSGCGCVSAEGEDVPAAGLFFIALMVGRRRRSS